MSDTTKNENRNLSRRSFLKTAASAGVGAAAFAATGPAAAEAAAQAAPDVMTAELAAKKWAFEIPPDPIPESDIAATVSADVIVVGSGVSGLVAAQAAVENGAKVVLISASKAPVFRGGSFFVANSKFMKDKNLPPADIDQLFRREMANAGYRINEDKWYRFANNSEEAVNWLIDKMEAAGFETCVEAVNTEPNNGPGSQPIGTHGWLSDKMRQAGMGAQFVVETLAKLVQDGGGQIIFKTVAKQLVRDDNNTGRVSAVIAQGEDGKYTKYAGSKGVILATGDFSMDKEMMTKYCSYAVPLMVEKGDQGYDNCFKMGGLFKGDGQKMGLWVGAAWQRSFPNAPMIGCYSLAGNQPYGGHRGLTVNKNGYRYGNEDVNGPLGGENQALQPEMKSFSIWGTNYAEAAAPWHSLGMTTDSEPTPPAEVIKSWDKDVRSKQMVKGDTIEDVINQLGLPLEATKATIDRYNQFCADGVDADYHKRKELLVPIATGPFYGGVVVLPDLLTIMGGLRTNLYMQVCDATDTPIPGLYNVGTMIGDYFGNVYNFMISGNNLGANCLTFGYLTGRDVAKGVI